MSAENLVTRAEHKLFGGTLGFYEHQSSLLSSPMKFSVFLPAKRQAPPVLYYLAGLTCTDETFVHKSGAYKAATELGLCIVTLDTSPRAVRYPGDDESWDFGVGAGFYLDATAAPWSETYKMRSYVTQELRALVETRFAVARDRRGIFGHSMGGHGALTIGLSQAEDYASVSAFAPIVAPSQVPWGQKAFSRYLGENESEWQRYDTCALLASGKKHPSKLLVDQGTADKFLQRELRPELLRSACEASGQSLELRMHEGYDHSYFFISTFVEDHLEHHAVLLR